LQSFHHEGISRARSSPSFSISLFSETLETFFSLWPEVRFFFGLLRPTVALFPRALGPPSSPFAERTRAGPLLPHAQPVTFSFPFLNLQDSATLLNFRASFPVPPPPPEARHTALIPGFITVAAGAYFLPTPSSHKEIFYDHTAYFLHRFETADIRFSRAYSAPPLLRSLMRAKV